MIADEVVERVRESADIVAIIGERVKLRRMGRSWRGPCPLHGGKNPNFSVTPDKGVFHCFKCGESGDVFDFIRRTEGVDFVTAVRMVAARSGVEVPDSSSRPAERDPREPLWELNAAAAEFFQRTLWDDARAAAARAYLEKRRISRELADRFGLGYAAAGASLVSHLVTLGYPEDRLLEVGLLSRRDDQAEPYPRFRDRLMIPILDASGRCVGFGGRLLVEREGAAKYLNSPESAVFAKRRLLFNLGAARTAIRKAERAVVVEGYFDVIRLVAAGVEFVVGGLGTALTDEQARLLTRYTRAIFLLYDSDAAGQKAAFRAGVELLRQGVSARIVTLPEGEDPDTFVAGQGREALEAQLTTALDVFERQVQILERRGWFAELHRKRRAIDKLLPTIRAAADPLTRDLYLSRLAETAGVDRQVLSREVAEVPGGVSAAAHHAPPEGAGDDRRTSERRHGARRAAERPVPAADAERELVRAMLLVRPQLRVIADHVGPDEFREPRYREIYELLRHLDPEATVDDITGALSPEAAAVVAALHEEPGALQNVDRTVADSLAKLRSRALNEQIAGIKRTLSIAAKEDQNALLRKLGALQEERRRLYEARTDALRRPAV